MCEPVRIAQSTWLSAKQEKVSGKQARVGYYGPHQGIVVSQLGAKLIGTHTVKLRGFHASSLHVKRESQILYMYIKKQYISLWNIER